MSIGLLLGAREMENIGEGGVVVKGRATIDTRPPFGSVKEAVMLFGEKVLAGEIYAPFIKEMQATTPARSDEEKKQGIASRWNINTGGDLKWELEETKRMLEQVREEGKAMESAIKSLREELQKTTRELKHLKSKTTNGDHFYYNHLYEKSVINPEIEEIKLVEDNSNNNARELKKFVSFASPPSLARELRTPARAENGALGTAPFRKDGQKKPFGWLLLTRKKRT